MSVDEYLSLYRPNVGVLLFNKDAQVWLGRRTGDFADLSASGASALHQWRWQMPQGGIDENETVAAAAFRELKEETGIISARLLAVTPGWLAYDFPSGYKKKSWRGQRQKWAVMLFVGEDEEIDLEADRKQEFDAWRWAELEEIPSLIVPFKRQVYDDLVRSLTPLRDFLRSRR